MDACEESTDNLSNRFTQQIHISLILDKKCHLWKPTFIHLTTKVIETEDHMGHNGPLISFQLYTWDILKSAQAFQRLSFCISTWEMTMAAERFQPSKSPNWFRQKNKEESGRWGNPVNYVKSLWHLQLPGKKGSLCLISILPCLSAPASWQPFYTFVRTKGKAKGEAEKAGGGGERKQETL